MHLTTSIIPLAVTICVAVTTRASEHTFHIPWRGDTLVVPVDISGQQYQFILDTGTNHNILDSAFAKEGRYSTGDAIVYVPDKQVKAKQVLMPTAFIGPFRLSAASDSATLLDLSAVRQATGTDIRGIIGIEFFYTKVVTVNSDNKTISISETLPHDADIGTGIDVIFDRTGRPMVPCCFSRDDVRRSYLIDTGSTSSVTVTDKLFEELVGGGKIALGRSVMISTATGADIPRRRTGRVSVFHCGPESSQGIIVTESSENKVGMRLLSRYVVTLDLRRAKLYLKDSNRIQRRDEFDKSGLSLIAADSGISVRAASPDGPAFVAGIRASDTIVRINDRQVGPEDLQSVRNMLRGPEGEVMTIALRRASNDATISFKLTEVVGSE